MDGTIIIRAKCRVLQQPGSCSLRGQKKGLVQPFILELFVVYFPSPDINSCQSDGGGGMLESGEVTLVLEHLHRR